MDDARDLGMRTIAVVLVNALIGTVVMPTVFYLSYVVTDVVTFGAHLQLVALSALPWVASTVLSAFLVALGSDRPHRWAAAYAALVSGALYLLSVGLVVLVVRSDGDPTSSAEPAGPLAVVLGAAVVGAGAFCALRAWRLARASLRGSG